MKKKDYAARRQLNKYLHLLRRFSERLNMSPSVGELEDMVKQINTNWKECFLKRGKKPWVAVYKVKFRDKIIIVISDRKHIFTTYGLYEGSYYAIIKEQKLKELTLKEEKTDAPEEINKEL